MENFKTPMAMENEIFKATDFNFGYDSVIFNVAMAMKLILSGSKVDYVIGGSVTPYSSGGLNVSIAPLYALCNSTGVCVVEGDITEPVSFEEADSELDRIDIIEVCGTEVGYDSQLRKFIDPLSGVETTQTINTKKKIALSVTVKKGLNGSEVAPDVDSGYIKLAEVRIPAGTNDITNDMIRNIDAKKSGASNSGWTANKSATFNPGYITEVFQTFLTDHNEDGSHKNAVIDAEDINFGTETKQVKGTVIPTGQSMNIHEESYTSSKSITDLILALASNVNSLYGYSNDVLSRFSWIADVPVAASTGSVDIATGGEKTIDGVSCKIGQIVFLKNQENAIENGLYKVQARAWSRHTGYTAGTNAFAHKFIFVPAGTQNKGKIFFINVDTAIVGTHELNFRESVLSPYALGNSLVTRDSAGRAQFATPVSANDAANKDYTDSKATSEATTKANAVQANLDKHTSATTGVHGATSEATANKIAIRDSAGRLQVASPSVAKDAANKEYVDSKTSGDAGEVQANLDTHVNNKSNPHAVSLGQLGVTATASELNKLDGFTGSASKLNFTNNLTSDAQAQINSKVASSTYNSHVNAVTGIHGATSAPTANRIAIRDGSGRMQVASPSANADATNKQYVDSTAKNPGNPGTPIVITTSQTKTITPGWYLIEIWGGGGGGGGGSINPPFQCGGGGGGGGLYTPLLLYISGNSISIEIGRGGRGSDGAEGSGGNGEPTYVIVNGQKYVSGGGQGGSYGGFGGVGGSGSGTGGNGSSSVGVPSDIGTSSGYGAGGYLAFNNGGGGGGGGYGNGGNGGDNGFGGAGDKGGGGGGGSGGDRGYPGGDGGNGVVILTPLNA